MWQASVSLPACLPAESSAPALQPLVAEELARKEMQGWLLEWKDDGFWVTSVDSKDGDNAHAVPAWITML